MILLVGKAPRTLNTYGDQPRLGRLIQPRDYGAEDDWAGPWAADNDCYQGFNEPAYLRMLAHLTRARNERLLFVTAPDVVGDATATLALFAEWEPRLHALHLPVALVGQDGLTADDVPWDRLEALFIGGTTEWKMGLPAARLTHEAKARGLWVHMGRVNSVRRIRYAQAIGCDSFDGTQFSRFSDTYLLKYLGWIGHRQEGLAL